MAELWLPVIKSWSTVQMESWLRDILSNWQEGYSRVVKDMDVATRKAEHERVNEAIRAANNNWSAYIEQQREMILAMIAGLLTKVLGA